MSHITLTDLANLQNETTAVSAINSNNAIIENAFDNCLTKDGSIPNQMTAAIDMNSNRVLNLPLAISADEPVRLQDLANYATGGTVTFNALPVGGTTNQYLKKNSGSNYDVSWATNTTVGIPTGGAAGQVLTKNTGTNYDVSWTTVSSGGGGGGGSTSSFNSYATVAAVQAATIPNTVTEIDTQGYYSSGDGGGTTYVHTAGAGLGVIQSLDGQYWKIKPQPRISVKAFGAKVDGSSIDDTALQNGITYTASVGSILYIPAGVMIIQSNIRPVSNSVIEGSGKYNTTIRKQSASAGVTMFGGQYTSGSPLTGFRMSDLTIDGNASTIASQFYILAFIYFNDLVLERLYIQRPYNGGLIYAGNDGSITPTPPIASNDVINSGLTIRNCTFDGNSQKIFPNNGDLFDLICIDRLLFENNNVIGSASNGLAMEFNTRAVIRNNTFQGCLCAIYQETSQDFSICDNSIYFGPGGIYAPSRAVVGIWLCDAGQTYGTSNWQGCQRGIVTGNKMHGVSRSTGSAGVIGIQVSAPVAHASQDILIQGNMFSNNGVVDSTGTFTGVWLEGGVDAVQVLNNYARSDFTPNQITSHNNNYLGGFSETNVLISNNINS